jgi:hypothetical protein
MAVKLAIAIAVAVAAGAVAIAITLCVRVPGETAQQRAAWQHFVNVPEPSTTGYKTWP